MKNEVLGFIFLVVLLSMLFVFASKPGCEARAFNKFTDGPKATYWDALWLDLRVTP